MRALRCLQFIGATTALFAAVLVAAPADAAPVQVLTVNRLGAGGVPAAVGDSLTSGLAANTMLKLTTIAGGNVGLSCPASTITAILQNNPVVPGVATLQLNPWTVGPGCVSTIPGVARVNGVKVNGTPDPMSVSDAVGLPIQIGPGANLQIVVSLTLNNGMGAVCTYTPVNGIINGAVTLNTSQWVFTNQQFTVAGMPAAACGAPNAFLSASFNPVVDATQLNGPVFDN